MPISTKMSAKADKRDRQVYTFAILSSAISTLRKFSVGSLVDFGKDDHEYVELFTEFNDIVSRFEKFLSKLKCKIWPNEL